MFLFVVGLAGFTDVDRAAVGERESGGDEAVGAEQATNCLPVARGVVVLEAFAATAQEVVGEHADKPKSWEARRQTADSQLEGCRSREAKVSTCGRQRGFDTRFSS